MRQTTALWVLGLLALASGALAVRPEPAGAGAELHVGGGGSEKKLPWFCHNLQCPKFTVVNATGDYEVRRPAWGMTQSTLHPALHLLVPPPQRCRCCTFLCRCGTTRLAPGRPPVSWLHLLTRRCWLCHVRAQPASAEARRAACLGASILSPPFRRRRGGVCVCAGCQRGLPPPVWLH